MKVKGGFADEQTFVIHTCWIPLYVGAHEVLAHAHAGEVAGVDELQDPVHAPESCQDHKLSSWSPEQMVGSLPLVLLQNLGFCALLQA